MVERIVEFSARNRAFVLIGVAFAVVASVWAASRVRLDAIPDLSDPQVIVYAEWMGRGPTLIEDQVTYPLVSALVAAPKVADVRGYSMFGMSFIYVLFEEGTDVWWARSRVLESLATMSGRLPEGVAPALGPDATGIGWVYQYTLVDHTGKLGLDELRSYQDFTLKNALGSVSGVAEVASIGGFAKQYQVTIDPSRLEAYGLTLGDVAAAVRESNADVGGRVVEMSGREYYVRGRGYLQDLGSLENVVLRGRNGSQPPLLLRDVASVRFGPDIRRGLLEWNGEGEAVGGIVIARTGENAYEVIERVKARIAELVPSLPPGVEIVPSYDRSDLIDRAIDTLKHALLEEAVVVSLVILLFLLHFRSALLPILSLPVAVALSFLPMYLLDIPGTIMSLGGIAIAIGATVDAEIVMVEAAHKKLERARPGDDRRKLLADAAREVTPAIFFSLLVIAVAFLPVFTLTGQAGRLFKPLAYTKTFVMVASALVSITFAPALRDLLLRGKMRPESKHPVSKAIVKVYQPFVFVALRRPKSTIAMGLLAILSAVPLARELGHEFMPQLNEGDLLYMPTTFPGISIEEAKRQLQAQDRVLRGFPEVMSVSGKVGRAETATDPAPLSMVETTVRLKPQNEWRQVHEERWYSTWAPDLVKRALAPIWPETRTITWDELTAEMNAKMLFPGWTNAYTMPIKTRVDMLTTGVRTPVGVKVLGRDLDEIERIGPELERVIAGVPGTRSVFYERNSGGLYLDIVPNREALARFGLRVGDVERIVENAIGGATVTTTVEGRARYSVNLRFPQDLRSDVERLKRLPVPIPSGSSGGSGGDGMGMGKQGSLLFRGAVPGAVYAMGPMGGGDAQRSGGAAPRAGGASETASDVPGWNSLPAPSVLDAATGGTGTRLGSAPRATSGLSFVPLGDLADIRIASGPPMLRDEDGSLAGYVYVDVDLGQRDLGGYVDDAKKAVRHAIDAGTLKLAPGYQLVWTGQYEHLEEMNDRMRIAIPATIALIVLLLVIHFGSLAEALIVLLSIPFALVGSVWLLWLLDYRMSTAVWIGIIALVGLAAQTGIVMILYIDHAFERRKAAGKIRDLNDIIWAHMEGTVQRVRPKLMTVATMLAGLIPLLWAEGSGADVMRRIAAPMIGGLVTSAFLTLEIIPVVYTYWRWEQLVWEKVGSADPSRFQTLRVLASVHGVAWFGLFLLGASYAYVTLPASAAWAIGGGCALVLVGSAVTYLTIRNRARALFAPVAA